MAKYKLKEGVELHPCGENSLINHKNITDGIAEFLIESGRATLDHFEPLEIFSDLPPDPPAPPAPIIPSHDPMNPVAPEPVVSLADGIAPVMDAPFAQVAAELAAPKPPRKNAKAPAPVDATVSPEVIPAPAAPTVEDILNL